jgi:ankyrin repeat protein
MISATCDQTAQLSAQVVARQKTKAPIQGLPIDVVIMIVEILEIKDALELCDALQLPEHVAVQYGDYIWKDFDKILDDFKLKPNSYKFVLKNKRFQIEAHSEVKTEFACKTFDLEFVKNYIEEVKLDLNEALLGAASAGFTDAVTWLLSDSRVDPSANDGEALWSAVLEGHVEVVKLLLSDSRVDPSADNGPALWMAAEEGHVEVVKLLLGDSRVDPSSNYNEALREAVHKGHVEIVKLLLSDPRFHASAETIDDILYEAQELGYSEIVKLLQSINI